MAEGNGNGMKISVPKTVSLGNMLTIFTMIAGGVAVWVRIEISDARQDEKIQSNERRITAMEVSRISSSDRLAQELSQINTRLSRIEGALQRERDRQ